jgi:hypothetical protein
MSDSPARQRINARCEVLIAEADRSMSCDYATVGHEIMRLEHEAGLTDPDFGDLPAELRGIALGIAAEVRLYRVAFADFSVDPDRFRCAFSVASRFANVQAYARGAYACLLLTVPPAEPAPAKALAATPVTSRLDLN